MTSRAPYLVFLGLASCAASPNREPTPVVTKIPPPAESDEYDAQTGSQQSCNPRPRPARAIRPPAELPPSPGDPLGGRFDLASATAGLSGEYPLEVTITTSQGKIECELWEHVAPRTVASFVGLARGKRPFLDSRDGAWKTAPFFDGLTFHRVIPGFMIQGGDPQGTGRGGPGYALPDEIDESVQADRPGLLYMANSGPNTNGSQFFILDRPQAHIAGRYTAFGECSPSSVVSAIASVRTGAGDRPVDPVTIERIDVAFSHPCR